MPGYVFAWAETASDESVRTVSAAADAHNRGVAAATTRRNDTTQRHDAAIRWAMMILHLALASDWASAVAAGSYRVSTRGLTVDEVGFIHCSTPAQVDGVAARFYADVTDPLVVLALNADAVREDGTEVRFEDGGGGELFPHIYGPIDPNLVIEARPAAMIDGALVVG